MYQIIIVFHILVGLGVIGLVLMQQGKGADAGAAFGSGASGTIFGARGSSSFLSRTTAIFATLFFVTSLGLAVFGGKQVQTKDIMDTPAPQSEVPVIGSEVPAVPAAEQAPTVPQAPVAPQPQVPPAVAEPPASQPAAPAAAVSPADNAEVPAPPANSEAPKSAAPPAAKE